MIELSLTNLTVILIATLGGLTALIKIIAVLFERGIRSDLNAHYNALNERLAALDSAFKLDASQWQRVERELLQMKADLPLHYVRREDYIRGQTVMEAKQDALYSRIELLQQQIQTLIKEGSKNG